MAINPDLIAFYRDPAAQLRYMERVRARLYNEYMNTRTYGMAAQALARLEAVEAAIAAFDPAAHAAAVAALDEARDWA